MMITEASKGGYIITVDVPYPVDAVWAIVHYHVGKTWDDAIAYAAQAGPMPLVSSEPWVEGDAEYAKRIGHNMDADYNVVNGRLDRSTALNMHGRSIGLPRAHLTPVP